MFSFYCNAQSFNYDLRTIYDSIGRKYYGFQTGVTLPNDPVYFHQNSYYGNLSSHALMAKAGDGMSYALESLVIMYKTTKDKAYLYEFIRHALELQHWGGNKSEVCISEIKNNTL